MKKLAIGCGIVALLCAALIAGLMLAWPKIRANVTGWVQEQTKTREEQEKLDAAWQPPTAEPGAQWFPEDVGGWKRSSAEPIHEVPEVSVTRDGYRAAYIQNGHQIEVKVIPVTELESDSLFERSAGFKPLPENRGFTSSTSMGKIRQTKYGNGERLYVRLIRDWFVLMHTLDAAEITPFAEAWIHDIDTQPRPEAPR
jgi:hypothetical protein